MPVSRAFIPVQHLAGNQPRLEDDLNFRIDDSDNWLTKEFYDYPELDYPIEAKERWLKSL